ncbi:unnamed protein product [Clonostachys solani]|uniref:Heterokaryon incompatibility domain-containing protein n=1 Tax=Clonostachys solani TaxID=160281 RepID=A0A9N9ZAD0_9HYPO|nr:unnamed protein product [Clonostachys solani]
MRLIHTRSLKLREFNRSIPPYAILSHTWGTQEVTFQEFRNRSTRKRNRGRRGLAKILATCRQARRQGFEYVWVDSCCIDKRSSTELSEAINSMFKWYQNAHVCYAYLEDVSVGESRPTGWTSGGPPVVSTTTGTVGLGSSRWFTRGWTLQELIAPTKVEFYDTEWNYIGEKHEMASEIRDITGIDTFVIKGSPLEQVCVAKKMSWAAHRETRRKEDIAYSLFGIFGVNMPLVYGEGSKAFLRLQEEILRRSDDQTIFAWRSMRSQKSRQVRGLFANSPREFSNFYDGLPDESNLSVEPSTPSTNDHLVRVWDFQTPQQPIAMTNRGIRITGRIQDLRAHLEPHNTVILILNCCFGGDPRRAAGIYLQRQDNDRYARIRPHEIAVLEREGRHVGEVTLYGLTCTAEIRGHHYDQPWTSSYQIRMELMDSQIFKAEDVEITRKRYEDSFYMEKAAIRPRTLFGTYKLQGFLMTDSSGLLRFFCFDPTARHLNLVLKTYTDYRVVLVYRDFNGPNLVLVALGQRNNQPWMDAVCLTEDDVDEDSSSLLNAMATPASHSSKFKEVLIDDMHGQLRFCFHLKTVEVEGITMSELQINGPWPASFSKYTIHHYRHPLIGLGIWGITVFGLWYVGMVGFGDAPPDGAVIHHH